MCGNLLDDLDEATRAEVLGKRFIECPLVIATNPFARMIQIELEKIAYFDMQLLRFIRTKITQGSKLGPMGCRRKDNRVIMMIMRIPFLQSHLIYLWFTGDLPKAKQEIDHIDGDPSNDSLVNLRVVPHSVNCKNMRINNSNTSGYAGVSYVKRRGNYQAYITVNYKRQQLGIYVTAEDAYAARKNYINTHPELGFTARHGL